MTAATALVWSEGVQFLVLLKEFRWFVKCSAVRILTDLIWQTTFS